MSKTNRFMKKFLLVGISCLLMISCTSSPEDYQVQINDAVKFYLASCDLLIQYEQDVKAEEFFDTMLEELVTTTDDEGFKQLLTQKVAENNKYAKKVYYGYENANILLSPYTLVGENVWEFEELGTEIHFTFSITTKGSTELWEIFPNEKDIDKYIWKKALGEDGLQTLRDLGLDIDSLFEETMREVKIEEQIAAVVHGAYSGTMDDKEVMTDDFYTELQQAFKYSSLDVWAWNGYWKFNDGSTHNYEIVEYDHDNPNYTLVYITFDDIKPNRLEDIVLYMKLVDGMWMISDICGIEWGKISYSIADFASMTVAENETDHEGSY